MRRKAVLTTVVALLALIGLAGTAEPLWAQTWAQDPLLPIWAQQRALLNRPEPKPAAPKTIAIRAGNLFDPVSGKLVPNQVILILGDRITEVGPAGRVQIPPGASVMDLSKATVLPGLIDGHLHVSESAFVTMAGKPNPRLPAGNIPTTQAELDKNIEWALIGAVDALKDLHAGFTTIVDLGALGSSYATIAMRDAINNGMIPGPRMLVAGPTINEINPNVVTAEEGRAVVRELAAHRVDWVKLNSSGAFTMRPDDTFTVEIGNPKTLEAHKAIVDEAKQRGIRVACHSYGGEGLRNCIEAGAYPQHGVFLTDADVKLLLQYNVPLGSTLFELRTQDPADMGKFGNSRFRMMEKSFKKALAAGVKQSFSSGAQTEHTGFPHGSQNEMFAVFVKWGMTPAQALRTATTTNAEVIGWQDRVGTIEKGKFADIIAVAADPLKDITELQRVRFVMKGGTLVRNDLR